jgi:hypothetical protein
MKLKYRLCHTYVPITGDIFYLGEVAEGRDGCEKPGPAA